MEALIEVRKTRYYGHDVANLEAFNKFMNGLKTPRKLSNGDIEAIVGITCYSHNAIHSFDCKILLINHGINLGRIWVKDHEEGFSPENILLGARSRRYYCGRSGKELVVEVPDEDFVFQRIDLEEKASRTHDHLKGRH